MGKLNYGKPALMLALLAAMGSASATVTYPGKQIEYLSRGVVAIATNGAKPIITWRALATDVPGTLFNVYRGTTKLTTTPTAKTNWVDSSGTSSSVYSVRAVVNGVEQAADSAGTTWANQILRVPVQRPAGGTTPDGVAYTYNIGDASPVDLDGDGNYEIVFRWDPSNAKDNSQSGYTGNTYLDAYKLDGTRLWRIDLGRNIRSGAHYSPFVAYDLDGDGLGEVMVKTADGTIDGAGTVIGSAAADHRNSAGYVLSGPEYLTVFNGLTGAAMQTVNFNPPRGNVAAWGDNYGNRVDRFLAGVANLDGARPSAIFSRGYYTRAVVTAWDWRDGKLASRWVFDTDVEGPAARGQGAHWFSVADVDNDGKDDIIFGAATISSYGKLLYSTGLGHGDALHVGKLDPNRPGQQVYMVHEEPGAYGATGVEMHDAATGALLWGIDGQKQDIGRGVCMDIDARYPGEECWATVGGVRSATGSQISAVTPSRINFGIWWDGDLLRESLDVSVVDKWNPATSTFNRLLTAYNFGGTTINSSKSNPVLSADLFGDWREEFILRSNENDALIIYSTTYPTETRLTTLMHNPQYRAQVAGQNMGYNQPPHPSFYLGDGMAAPAQETVHMPFDGKGTIQAETAVVGGGTVQKKDRVGYYGTGFLAFPSTGGSAEYRRIDGGAGGQKTITIRYANGNPTPRTGVLRVNGVPQAIIFKLTGSWTIWSTMSATVNLVPGMNNTLRFESTGQSLANIDEIAVP
jgi:rhamnogalacturonan endolyase